MRYKKHTFPEKFLYFMNLVAFLVLIVLRGHSIFFQSLEIAQTQAGDLFPIETIDDPDYSGLVLEVDHKSDMDESSYLPKDKELIFALGSYDKKTANDQIELILTLHKHTKEIDNVVILTLDKSGEEQHSIARTVPFDTQEICIPEICLPAHPFSGLVTLPGAGPIFKSNSDTINSWIPLIYKTRGKNVTVLPIVMSLEKEKFNNTDTIVNKVFELIPSGKTLVIASTRLSRYQDDRIAKYHDRNTLQAIQSNIFEGKHIEAEIPNLLKLITNLANRAGQKDFFPLAYSSDQKLSGTKSTENATHLFGYFESRKNNKSGDEKNWKDVLGILSDYKFLKNVESRKDLALGKERTVLGIRFGDGHFTRGIEEVDALKTNYPGKLMSFLNQYQSADMLGGDYFHKTLYGFDEAGFNLETAVGIADECDIWYGKGIIFRTEPHRLQIFKDVGFSLVNAANNHSHDCGAKGWKYTKQHLDEYGIEYFGHTRFGTNILTKDYDGVKVAWFGFNDVDTPNDWDLNIEQIKKYKSDGYHVIVNLHRGKEYVDTNNEGQQELGHRLIDEGGVDLIIGHHPHMIQNIEYYNNVPIVYSLGNFIFDQPFPETLKGMALLFAIGESGVKIEPLYFNRNKGNFEARRE